MATPALTNVDASPETIYHVLSLSSTQHLFQRLTFPNGKSADFILDTGSPINFMPVSVLTNLHFNDKELQPSSVIIKGVAGDELPVLGECDLNVRYNASCVSIHFVVTAHGPMVLGLKGIRKLKINLNSAINYTSVKTGNIAETMPKEIRSLIHRCSYNTGGMKVTPAHLEVSALPKFKNARPMAFGIRDEVKKALNNLVDMGVLTPVATSAWATPIEAIKNLLAIFEFVVITVPLLIQCLN